MRKIIYYTVTLLFVFTGFAGCKSPKSNRQLFLENLEKNIDICAEPIINKGVDTATARRICRCMLEFQYEKDSTFMQMSEEEYNQFIKTYGDEMLERCGDIQTKE